MLVDVDIIGFVTNFSPTDEQQAIIDAFATGDGIAVEAYAGAAKTTTLKMLGDHASGRHGVYVAYNRAIAMEAKRTFASSVSCSTMHSLAFRAIGWRYEQRLNAPRVPIWEAAKVLGSSWEQFGDRRLSANNTARFALDTVRNFCNSAFDEIEARHVPWVNGIEDEARDDFIDYILPIAREAWRDMRREDGQLQYSHDCYLKTWALSRPHIDCDFILADEWQDANGVIAFIVSQQIHAQQVVVGDAQQQLYRWRGAINALEKWDSKHRLPLTQSFRFGSAIADEANKWLGLLEITLPLRGYDKIDSTVGPVDEPRAVISRTNAEAVAQVMIAQAAGRTAAFSGGEKVGRLAEAALKLQSGERTTHPELVAFSTWSEVQEYAYEEHGGGRDLRAFVGLVDNIGAQRIINCVSNLLSDDSADVIFTTVHSGKGREFRSVKIADDFVKPKDGELRDDELRVAYVAVTRAQEQLDVGSLRWIDDYLLNARLLSEQQRKVRKPPLSRSEVDEIVDSTK